MRDSFLAIYRFYGKVLWFAAILAGIATFLIMWVIDVNALSRKVFNAPLPAGVEMVQALLVVAIMLPFGYTLAKREHVNTVFLTSRFPGHVRRWVHFFWMVVGFLIFAAVTYGTFRYALRSYAMNEQIWGATIQFPVWPAKMAVSLGAILICIQFLLDAVHTVVDDRFHDLDPYQTVEQHAAEQVNV